MTNPAHPSTAASHPAHSTPPNPDAAWNKSPRDGEGAWRRFSSALPMRASLMAVAVVWGLGCVWSYQEQSAFAASRGFAFPHLLPLVIDGFAVSMAGVSWAASLDARPAIPARMATVLAVGASSASNGVWAYLRTQHDMVTVVLGVAVPIAANLAFEVLLAELRRQVQRRRGLPPPIAVPYPRLIRVFLAPFQTFRAWRAIVLDLTSMDRAINPAAKAVTSQQAPARAAATTEPYPAPHLWAPTVALPERSVDSPVTQAVPDGVPASPAPTRSEHPEPAHRVPASPTHQHARHTEPPAWSARLDHPEPAVTLPYSTSHQVDTPRTSSTNGTPPLTSPPHAVAPPSVGPAQAPRSSTPSTSVSAAPAPATPPTNGYATRSVSRPLESEPAPQRSAPTPAPAPSAGPKAAPATRKAVGTPPSARPSVTDSDDPANAVESPAASGSRSGRAIDQRVERLAQHLATAEDGDDLTGERVAQLLGIDVAPRTGRRLLGQARELLNQRMAGQTDIDDELSVIGGR